MAPLLACHGPLGTTLLATTSASKVKPVVVMKAAILVAAFVAAVAALLSYVPVDKYPSMFGKLACASSVTYCRTEALHSAVRRGNVKAVRALLESGLANAHVRDSVCGSTRILIKNYFSLCFRCAGRLHCAA